MVVVAVAITVVTAAEEEVQMSQPSRRSQRSSHSMAAAVSTALLGPERCASNLCCAATDHCGVQQRLPSLADSERAVVLHCVPHIGAGRRSDAPYNLLGRMTLGLVRLHKQLRAADGGQSSVQRVAAGPASLADSNLTTRDGSLRLSASIPLLGARYQYLSCIGEGAFSQILECRDTYWREDGNTAGGGGCSSQSAAEPFVAIKVMNRKFRDIGAQELEMLRYLRARDRQAVVKLVPVGAQQGRWAATAWPWPDRCSPEPIIAR